MNIDDLTNIYNRRCFNEDITATDLQKEKIVAVAMLDIDYFKEYNDIYGHQMGDQALVKIGRCMKQYEKRGRFSFISMEGMSFLLFSSGSQRNPYGKRWRHLRMISVNKRFPIRAQGQHRF